MNKIPKAIVCGVVVLCLVAVVAVPKAWSCSIYKYCNGALIWCETWGECETTFCVEIPRGILCECGDAAQPVYCPPMN